MDAYTLYLPSKHAHAYVIEQQGSFSVDPVKAQNLMDDFVASGKYLGLVYNPKHLAKAREDAIAHGLPLTTQMKSIEEQV